MSIGALAKLLAFGLKPLAALARGYPLPVLALFGACLWLFVCFVISRVSGWAALSELYPRGDIPPEGEALSGESALMRWNARYGGCLTFAADGLGLRVSIAFILRPWHPPLFIPWCEVTAAAVSGLAGDLVELRFQRAPGIPLRIMPELAALLAQRAGRGWLGG